MRRFALGLALAIGFQSTQTALYAATVQERLAYWNAFSKVIPPDPPFDEWMKSTHALPPDFDALAKNNPLPDPLTFEDGKRKVVTADDWKERRAEILNLYEEYDIGTIPPKPALDQIVPVDPAVAAREAAAAGRGFGRGGFGRGPATRPAMGRPASGPAGLGRRGGFFGGRGAAAAPGSITRVVDLKYGPNDQLTTRVTLTIPPGTGPFPVLMCGTPAATARGYICCAFNNSVDPSQNAAQDPTLNLKLAYPGYTFGSMGQVAFTSRMVVDYLYTLPDVDKPHIAITGYSRLGKAAVIAAAVEERITAVVAGSTGVGGIFPWRLGGEYGAAEGIESTTRSFPTWFTQQLRFFTGREDRLPVDGNLLQALIAPRSIISLYGLSDEVGNTYGNEQSYYSSEKVFTLLGVPDRNSIIHPPGHHGANDVNATMDWLDIQFGKSTKTWDNKFLYPWDYERWKSANQSSFDLNKFPPHDGSEFLGGVASTGEWEKKAADVRQSVQWMLGNPDGGKGGPDPAQRGRDDVVDWAISRGGAFGWLEPEKSATDYRSLTFGHGTRGELYFAKGTRPDARLPVVIWLHGFSYPMGYMWVYRSKPDLHPILALVRAGYAVFAFDQTGHGSRTDEFATFFDRYPNGSHMGRMVADTRAAIDALQKDPMVDGSRVYLYGYSMGGMVALHAAALDDRVKGVVSICGFTPMRSDTADKGTGGIARYSVTLPLLPRLGFFIGNESRLPYDYNELMAAVAPRPVYVVQPQLDRDATPADVHAAVDQAKKVFALYNASGKIVLDEPFDYNRLPEVTQDRAIKWMTENMK